MGKSLNGASPIGDAVKGRPLILYVDDDDLVAHLVQREISDLEILRVSNGDQAIEFLNQPDAPRPALVLLDLHMPKRDGFQILGEIRAIPSLAALPVAIFTTSLWPSDREKAFALGANYFIPKPFSLEGFSELATTLGNIIRSSREATD